MGIRHQTITLMEPWKMVFFILKRLFLDVRMKLLFQNIRQTIKRSLHSTQPYLMYMMMLYVVMLRPLLILNYSVVH